MSPSWSFLTPNESAYPYNRSAVAMAYDPQLNGTLLFGGYNVTVAADGDTWLFTNGSWVDLTPRLAVSPAARWYDSLVWDPVDHYLVLFGGGDTSRDYNDTWVFQNHAWRRLTTSSAPPERRTYQMAWDPTLNAIYLFGGFCKYCAASGVPKNDSWTFVGGVWTNITSRVTSAPATLGYMAWDAADGYMLGFGDLASGCIATGTNVTFAFDGGQWTTVANAGGPFFSAGGSMIYDPANGYVLLYGGTAPANSDCWPQPETWSYRGGLWTNLTPTLARAPYEREGQTLAFDASAQAVLMFGGAQYIAYTFGNYLGETWSFPGPPLYVSENASATYGEAPLTVDFSASVQGGAGGNAVSWAFGDGSAPATGVLAVHVYTTPGTYVATLSVTDGVGQSVDRNVSVTVIPGLAAAFAASPTAGLAPLAVTLNASTSGGVPPYQYLWQLGDGSAVATGAWVNHTYTATGSFTVHLTTTDALGRTFASSTVVKVVAPLASSAHLSTHLGAAPLAVNYSAMTSGGLAPLGYAWDFGDGSSATSATGGHSYAASGTYDVTLTVTDTLGETTSDTAVVTVYAPLVVAFASSSTSVAVGQYLNLSGEVTGGYGADSYSWSSLPPGCTNADILTLSCQPSEAGSYSVALHVSDANNDSESATISVSVTTPSSVATPGGGPALPLLAIGIGVLVAVVAIVVIVLLLRRRPGPPAAP